MADEVKAEGTAAGSAAPAAPAAPAPSAQEMAEAEALMKKGEAFDDLKAKYDALFADVAGLKASIKPPEESDQLSIITQEVRRYAKGSNLSAAQTAALLAKTLKDQGLLDEAQAPALAREAEVKGNQARMERELSDLKAAMGATQYRATLAEIRETIATTLADEGLSKEELGELAEDAAFRFSQMTQRWYDATQRGVAAEAPTPEKAALAIASRQKGLSERAGKRAAEKAAPKPPAPALAPSSGASPVNPDAMERFNKASFRTPKDRAAAIAALFEATGRDPNAPFNARDALAPRR